jgi:Tol biopolymer transport system component/DNA-binding winged helix-turn-helix (wHTH) protein
MSGAVRDPVFRFGPFAFDTHAGELRKGPTLLKVPYQPIEILKALLERPGELVTREQLRERLWPSDTFVDFEHGLNAAVRRIREALGDSADAPKYIETLPRRGYRFIASVESVPRLASDQSPNARKPEPDPSRVVPEAVHAHQSYLRAAAVIVAIVAVALWIGWSRRNDSSSARRIPPSSIPVTSFPGMEADPDLSPDGSQVAFASQRDTDDNFNLYVMSVDSGDPRPLTTNRANERSPAWSPDGSRIAFLRATRAGSAVVVVPALGGGEKTVTETQVAPENGQFRSHGLSWTPDSKEIVFVDRGESGMTTIVLCSIATGERRPLTRPSADYGDTSPAVSPDGRYLAFVRHGRGTNLGAIFVQQLDASHPVGDARPLTEEAGTGTLAWTHDSARILYERGETGLFQVRIGGGTPEPVLTNARAVKPSISRNGARLVYQNTSTDANIWKMPGPAAQGGETSHFGPQRVAASTLFELSPHFSPDGQKITFVSTRSGNMEIWAADSDGSRPSRLTSLEGPFVGSPRWSPDQKLIAFDSVRSGNFNVYTVGVENGHVRAVTTDTFANIRPSWSANGQWIYFTSNRSGDAQIWKVAASGGPPIEITSKGGYEAFESPDGKDLYYAKEPGTPGIWKVPVKGGDEVQVIDRGNQLSWGVTQQGIVLLDGVATGHAKVELFRFDSLGMAAAVVELPAELRLAPPRYPQVAISPDAQWILYVNYDQWGSDIHRLQGSW